MKKKWWKEGIVYQIYPRSFNDSNGDGIGDIRGIINKVDYIQNLGVNIIWLNPVYKSPNDDNGYDISDYMDIMNEFGTMEDWEELLEELHKRKIKLIMDLVVNHTSDEHEWFLESKKSKDNPYRDYYIWKDGKKEKEPNNWLSIFGGSAWKYDENTEQYYLHLFSKKQPDLNWENSEVRDEIYDMMKWWLDKGIDGFRLDAINLISKVKGLPDTTDVNDDGYGLGTDYYVNGPKFHKWIEEANINTFGKYDAMTVGECGHIDDEGALKLVGESRNELDMIFNFDHMKLDLNEKIERFSHREWKLTEFKEIFEKWHRLLYKKGWNSIYLGNHDFPRAVSRYGNDDEFRVESSKMLGTFLMTMPGTPYIYQGDEIGMTNSNFKDIEKYRDVETLNYYKEQKEKGLKEEEIMEKIAPKSRDNARTPMQWNSNENAGFSTGTPWIDLNSNYKNINVEDQMGKKGSVLEYYKKIIRYRKNNLGLVYGDFKILDKENEKVFSYIREYENEKYLIILSFFEKESKINLGNKIDEEKLELEISNYEDRGKFYNIRPYEARIYKFTR
ncbi:MAG: glycoside hydrolase family 13 protein [Fusobacteriota bacterium]